MKGKCVILEGSWWRTHEAPQVLPYMQALAASNGGFDIGHHTLRCADDVKFWIKKIPKDARALVYFACHGEGQDLLPVGERSRVTRAELIDALACAKRGAVSFLHFGCCEIVDRKRRRKSLSELAQACDAYWVSGYTESVDWLRSTMLDIALVAEMYVGFARAGLRKGPKLQGQAKRFLADYNELARRLGFSGLSYLGQGRNYRLFPARLRSR